MITKDEALEMVGSLDDYARMGVPGGIAFAGVPHLEEYIKDTAKDAERYRKIRNNLAQLDEETMEHTTTGWDALHVYKIGEMEEGQCFGVSEELDEYIDTLPEC